jgi:hypothetical protein
MLSYRNRETPEKLPASAFLSDVNKLQGLLDGWRIITKGNVENNHQRKVLKHTYCVCVWGEPE